MLEWFDTQYQREKDDFIATKMPRESCASLGDFHGQDSQQSLKSLHKLISR